MKTFWIIFTTLSVMFNVVYLIKDYQDYQKVVVSSDALPCDVHAVVYSDDMRND